MNLSFKKNSKCGSAKVLEKMWKGGGENSNKKTNVGGETAIPLEKKP